MSPPPLPASPTYPLGYRAAMIRLRAEADVLRFTLTVPRRGCSLSPWVPDIGLGCTIEGDRLGITTVRVDPDEIAEEILATDVAKLGEALTMLAQLDLMKDKARASREAWSQSMDASNTARSKKMGTAHRGTDSAEDIADSDGSTTELADTCQGSSIS
ncbi:hypothetical protein Tco_0567130 [Tanacetum coccineum]